MKTTAMISNDARKDKNQPTVVSLFSGAGGMDLGFLWAGFKILWANDIDKRACETYRKNIGDHVHCGSIVDLEGSGIPNADVVIGGPPCQGFSVAGKMDPHDPRSELIWNYQRIVDKLRPKMFVMENVAALANLEKFADIRAALLLKYKQMGYRTEFQVLNAKDYEVPQNRERMILIGCRDPKLEIQFPAPCSKIISVREILSALPEPGIGINQGVCGAKITIAQKPIFRRSPYAGMLFNGLGRPMDLDRPAPTLPASMGGNKTPIIEVNVLKNPRAQSWIKKHHALVESGVPFDAYKIEVPGYLRRLTVRECAKIQTFPDDFEFLGPQSQQFKQIGNAVPAKLAYHVATAVMASLCQSATAIRKQAKPTQTSFLNEAV